MEDTDDTPDLVIIVWLDSRQPTSTWQWISKIEGQKPVRIKSVGWLIQDTAQQKVLASHLSDPEQDGDQQANGVITIPTRSVCTVTHWTALAMDDATRHLSKEESQIMDRALAKSVRKVDSRATSIPPAAEDG